MSYHISRPYDGNQLDLMSSPDQIVEFETALLRHATDYKVQISDESLQRLKAYYELLNTWNPRLHLVAPCSPSEFAQRHILESLLLLGRLPKSGRVIDVGSGAGLPIIPNLIFRPELSAVLIEVSKRKAVFLREALKLIEASSARVIAERFETLAAPETKFITSRALDKFGAKLPELIEWAPQPCSLLLFGGPDLEKAIQDLNLKYEGERIPNSERRSLFVVNNDSAAARRETV